MTLDTQWVRAQFPAFDTDALRDLAFFENAGGAYACRPVIDRLTRFYTERKMQPYGAAAPSRLGGEEMDEARSRLAAMLGVETDEVSFGPSTTQNTYVLAQAVAEWLVPDARPAARPDASPAVTKEPASAGGPVVIVTDQDHEANTGFWRRLATRGVEVRVWRIDRDTGRLETEALNSLLDGARLLTFPHCSNVVGEVNDVAAICALARAAGVRTVVDGVSYAPHGFPDVGALGADVYLFSAYKTYGPHQGIMTIRRDFGAELPNQAHAFNADALYLRFTPAGPDHAQVAACAGMVDYVEALSLHHGGPGQGAAAARFAHDRMRAQEVALLAPLLDFLTSRNSVRLLGPKDPARRAPTVAVDIGADAEAAAERLAGHGIIAGGGTFYAQRPLAAMGVDLGQGVLRLSFVHYTEAREVDRLIRALDQVL